MAARGLLVALALIVLPSLAMATGNADCEIDDENLKFTFEALYSYGSDGPLFQARAAIEPNARLFPGIGTIELDQSALKQQWFNKHDFAIGLYAMSPHFIRLIIEARNPSETDIGYEGRYALTIGADGNDAKVYRGAVSCSAG